MQLKHFFFKIGSFKFRVVNLHFFKSSLYYFMNPCKLKENINSNTGEGRKAKLWWHEVSAQNSTLTSIFTSTRTNDQRGVIGQGGTIQHQPTTGSRVVVQASKLINILLSVKQIHR